MSTHSHLLRDIRLELRHSELRPVYRAAIDLRRIPGKPGIYQDLGAVEGRENLAQAIILRLLTPRGELAGLGNPGYGSRLHELIGQQNTATRRSLVKLYILESLAEEPRIRKVLRLEVSPAPGARDRVTVNLQVQPVEAADVVTVGPFTLEL